MLDVAAKISRATCLLRQLAEQSAWVQKVGTVRAMVTIRATALMIVRVVATNLKVRIEGTQQETTMVAMEEDMRHLLLGSGRRIDGRKTRRLDDLDLR